MMNRLLHSLRAEPALPVILALFLLLAGGYSVVNPLHEGTDELRHYRFVRYIVEKGDLPVQGMEACRSQSHHPPLIYAMGALLTAGIDTGRELCANPPGNPFWAYRAWEVGTDNKNLYLPRPQETSFPWHGEALVAHLVRFLNVVLGGVTVALTYLTARVIWPGRRALAAGAAAFVAFNPMFLYMAGTINNDVIAAMSGAAIIYSAVRLLHEPRGVTDPLLTGFWLGVVYAVALLSKFSLAPLVVPLGLALFIATHRRRQVAEFLAAGFFMTLTAVAFAGWWFARNFHLYGDPTGFNPVTELWGVRTPAESWGLVWLELPNVWSSFWGRFGFGQIPLPEGIYQGLWILTVLAGGGALLWFFLRWANWRQARDVPFVRHRQKPAVFSLLVLLLTVAIAVAVVISYMLVSPAGAMGRFLFPGLPAFAILLFWGLTRTLALLARPAGRRVAAMAFLANGGMFTLSVVALWGYLWPAYAPPPSWSPADLPAEATLSGAVFEPFVRLHAYELQPDPIRPDEQLRLTLYWEVLAQPPGDYYFFAHVFDEIDSMVAQRDTHPAAGKFPAGQWRPGDRFVDRLSVPIPLTAYPAEAEVRIGFYAPNENYRLPVRDGRGREAGGALLLAPLTIAPRPGEIPQPIDRNFEGRVRLLGYEYNRRTFETGDALEVTLFWRPLPGADLSGLQSRITLTAGGEPLTSSRSWTAETAGGLFTERHIIPLEDLFPTGTYQPTLSLFDIFTDEPLNMIAPRGNWIDNELQLAAVRVADP